MLEISVRGVERVVDPERSCALRQRPHHANGSLEVARPVIWAEAGDRKAARGLAVDADSLSCMEAGHAHPAAWKACVVAAHACCIRSAALDVTVYTGCVGGGRGRLSLNPIAHVGTTVASSKDAGAAGRR